MNNKKYYLEMLELVKTSKDKFSEYSIRSFACCILSLWVDISLIISIISFSLRPARSALLFDLILIEIEKKRKKVK